MYVKSEDEVHVLIIIFSSVAKRANSINFLVVYFDSMFMLHRYFAIFT